MKGYHHRRSSLPFRGTEGSFAVVDVIAGKIVEVSPRFDPSGTTWLTASRCMRNPVPTHADGSKEGERLILADESRGRSRRMPAVRFDWYARALAEPARKRMTDIERWKGDARGRSRATAWRDLVFTVAAAPGPTVAEQTRASLAQISANLAEAGTDRTRLLSATVYLADIANKVQMDAEWCEWIGDSANWPQRACVQADLAPGTLVEITVVAARPPG